jgi:hypothetical protein
LGPNTKHLIHVMLRSRELGGELVFCNRPRCLGFSHRAPDELSVALPFVMIRSAASATPVSNH